MLVHCVAPNIRCTLPAASEGWPRNREAEIPRTIWQTNYTNRVTLAVYLNYLFNRLMAPGFHYRFMSTEDRRTFVRDHYGADLLLDYDQLQIGAAQADFWRVLVLQKWGGVYLDIDAHFVWPAESILKSARGKELYIQIKSGELSNYFIASAANNPHLGLVIDEIREGIASRSRNEVYDLTGPGVFNRVLAGAKVPTSYYLTTVNQGNFTNEYFQYIDKPQGKWTKEQQKISVLKPPQ